MQIYDLLTKDHEKVKNFLASLEKKRDDGLFAELKKEVIIHSEAEEEAFYEPLQSKAGKVKIMVKVGHEEHDLTMKMIKQLEKIENDEEWMQLFSVFKKSLESHIKMEEEDIYALGKQHFSNQEAEDIGTQMQKTKDKMAKEYKG